MNEQPDMRREFADRAELVAYVREQFPDAAAIDDSVAETRGGRKSAEARLRQIEPQRYAKSRNFLAGAVTRLSPFLRYGILSLAEVRDLVIGTTREIESIAKLVQELAWRDYWQRLYASMGDGIWRDQEPYKTGFTAKQYANDLPDDIRDGTTGMVCIDSFSRDMREHGWLHNHARMWLAAYIVHWRRVRWQAGAHWFLQHLLDGDPASNNLSWQWVASTFSHKPYMFNRENLEKYTDGVYCRQCPLYGHCDFEGSYGEIEADLFPNAHPENRGSARRGRS